MFINHIVVKTQNHQLQQKNNGSKNGLLRIKLSLKSQLTFTLGWINSTSTIHYNGYYKVSPITLF